MTTQRDILEAVSRGDLSPEEAADQLAALPAVAGGEPGHRPDGSPAGTTPPFDARGVRRIVVRASVCSVEILGDPAVTGAEASGPHEVRREGDTLVIEAEPRVIEDDSDARGGVFVFKRREGRRSITLRGGGDWRRTQIRMNPDLPLDLDVDAGSAQVEGIHGPITCDVDAGAARIVGFRSPINIDVDAGSVVASGTLTDGESRVRCDAGSAKVRLEPGSDVRVEVDVNLGRAEIRSASRPLGDRSRTIVLGEGTGSLKVDGDVANIQIDTP